MAGNSALAAKGSERSSSESAPAFDLKTLAGEASRKAQVTSRTQASSYVSKTAEEVKEVVAAMTKSIDRLVTNKSGAMNLKINFDQGGSMTLRISMDGGQVSTNMQTDVAGLESAIKSNWGEFANDWSQKGVKLNVPQFQQLAGQQADADSEANAWNEFNQRQERQGSFQNALGRNGNGNGNGSGARSGSQASGTASATELGSASGDGIPGAAQEANVISDTELKTYA